MQLLVTPDRQIKLSGARRLINEALEILDRVEEPGDVGTHLDLALRRLENHLGVCATDVRRVQGLRSALEI